MGAVGGGRRPVAPPTSLPGVLRGWLTDIATFQTLTHALGVCHSASVQLLQLSGLGEAVGVLVHLIETRGRPTELRLLQSAVPVLVTPHDEDLGEPGHVASIAWPGGAGHWDDNMGSGSPTCAPPRHRSPVVHLHLASFSIPSVCVRVFGARRTFGWRRRVTFDPTLSNSVVSRVIADTCPALGRHGTWML